MNDVVKMKENEHTMTIIEINGVKMEVDLRNAKVAKLEVYKIGTNVRILKKEYSDSYKTYAGVIIGFDQFEKRPSILIAYLSGGYSNADIEFITFNKDTKDIEICPADDTFVPFSTATVLKQLDNHVISAEHSLQEAISKKEYFTKYFNKYFDSSKE